MSSHEGVDSARGAERGTWKQARAPAEKPETEQASPTVRGIRKGAGALLRAGGDNSRASIRKALGAPHLLPIVDPIDSATLIKNKSEVVASLCPIGILADPPNFLPSAIGDPSGCLATLMPSSLGYMLLVPLPPHPVRGLALELRFSVFSALNLCQLLRTRLTPSLTPSAISSRSSSPALGARSKAITAPTPAPRQSEDRFYLMISDHLDSPIANSLVLRLILRRKRRKS